MTGPEQAVIDASAILEALRTEFGETIGNPDPDVEPVRQAWACAKRQMQAACATYIKDHP